MHNSLFRTLLTLQLESQSDRCTTHYTPTAHNSDSSEGHSHDTHSLLSLYATHTKD